MAILNLKMNNLLLNEITGSIRADKNFYNSKANIYIDSDYIIIYFTAGSIKIYNTGSITIIGSVNKSIYVLGRNNLISLTAVALFCLYFKEEKLFDKIFNIINDCRLVEGKKRALQDFIKVVGEDQLFIMLFDMIVKWETAISVEESTELFKTARHILNVTNYPQERSSMLEATASSQDVKPDTLTENQSTTPTPYVKHHTGTVHLGIHAMLNSIIEDIQKSINTNGVFVYDDGIEKMTVRVIPGIEVTGTSIPDMINVTIDSDYPSKKQTNDFISMEKKVMVVDQLKQAIMRSAIRSLNTSEQFGTHANFFADKK